MQVNDTEQKQNPTDRIVKFNDMVDFEFKYPADFQKKKLHKDGDVVNIHRLQAEDFASRKLGKIVGK